MDVLQVAFTSAAFLLAIAGVQKLRNPHALAGALRLAHLPHRPAMVRVLAGTEVVVAASAVLIHHWLAAIAVAALYVCFAIFVTWILARGLPIASCGCFGVDDGRPSPGHVALDAFAATVAALVAADDRAPVRSLIADHPAKGLGTVALAAACAVAATLWLRR